MILPETYQAALLLMITSMLCWGSWANTLKMCPKYRFQLFYWDYSFGMALAAVFLGLTAGSLGDVAPTFIDAITHAGRTPIIFALIGGAIFNVANLLLVAAIDVAGLAVAFPVGIGLALVIGAISNYLVTPAANPLLLFGGVALVTVAIVLDAAAYRKREAKAKATTVRGIVISLVAGVLMGCFYPFVARALAGTTDHPRPALTPSRFSLQSACSSPLCPLICFSWPSRSTASLPSKAPATGAPHLVGTSPARWAEPSGALAGRCQLRRLGRAPRWPGSQLHHRPGRYHGLSMLGCFRLARIRRRPPLRKNSSAFHVRLFLAGARRRCLAPLY